MVSAQVPNVAMAKSHEILAEGDEEEYSQHTTEQTAEEHLHEAHIESKNVDCRQGENGAGYDHAATGADALDYHVLTQCVLLAEGSADTYRQDGDWDGGLEHLANLEAQVGRRGAEQYGHQKTHSDAVQSDFLRLAVGRHQGFVFLSFFKWTMCVLW